MVLLPICVSPLSVPPIQSDQSDGIELLSSIDLNVFYCCLVNYLFQSTVLQKFNRISCFGKYLSSAATNSFVRDKAYVDGKWVTAQDGSTFEGKLHT